MLRNKIVYSPLIHNVNHIQALGNKEMVTQMLKKAMEELHTPTGVRRGIMTQEHQIKVNSFQCTETSGYVSLPVLYCKHFPVYNFL